MPKPNENIKTYSSRVVQSINDFNHIITLHNVPDKIRQGDPIVINGAVQNVTDNAWPIIMMDKAVLTVGGELKSKSGERFAAAHAFINKPVLHAQESADFTIALDTATTPPGEVRIHLDLVYEDVTWFEAKGAKGPIVAVNVTPSHEFSEANPSTSVQNEFSWLQEAKEFSPVAKSGTGVLREQDHVIHSRANPAAAAQQHDQAQGSEDPATSVMTAASGEISPNDSVIPGARTGSADLPVNLTHSQLIHNVYLGILGREADPVGLAGWMERLTNEPLHRLPAALVNSPEFLISYVMRMVRRDGHKTVARLNNQLSFATLGPRLHAARCTLIAEHLPKAQHVLDLGGASATDEGALLYMGYRGAGKISIVELPPDTRFKKALERIKTGTFFGTQVEYHYHSMADLSSYPDESVDLIWSGQTIEHVTLAEGDNIFRHAERILKPGGIFALDTPNRTLTRLAVGDAGVIHAEHKYEYRYEEFVERHAPSSLRLIDAKGLIDMPRSLRVGYLLPDEIDVGAINDHPQTSFVFFAAYRKDE